MNERIKQLTREAQAYATRIVGEDEVNFNIWMETYEEKIAKLIVRECGNWFNSRLVVEPDYGMEHRIERNRAVVGVMKEFNQHFGVEEQQKVAPKPKCSVCGTTENVKYMGGYQPYLCDSEDCIPF